MLEELERQRVENGKTGLQIVTCPNEMVALSAAQGFAQACGLPAAVFVHVDVGTQVSLDLPALKNPALPKAPSQALAGAVHNADRCRVPILLYAGASPFTTNGELKGSRNEWIMWLQGGTFFLPRLRDRLTFDYVCPIILQISTTNHLSFANTCDIHAR